MNVLFAGSGEFGLPTLRALLDAGHNILHACSQPDRPAGRGKLLTPTPIAQFCLDHHTPLTRTQDINAEEFPAADLLVVIAFGQKVSERMANHARMGSINLHASLLPRWRGAAPINWAILGGDSITGNSVIRLAQRMDSGAILAQSRTEIADLETAGELHDRLAVAGAALVLDVVRDMQAGRAVETPQDETRATRALKLNRDLAKLDFSQPAEVVARRIRGLFPWPGCRVQILDAGGRPQARLTLVRARPVQTHGNAGTIDAQGFVGCSTGRIEIIDVLPDGKRIMPLAAFRNGHPWEPGMRLEPVA
ncbi:MAG: methionyl-tRNA formyltransferase [Tepidisphaeraceae bacterium]|jgi:methionyl-tRNA formyltransferase